MNSLSDIKITRIDGSFSFLLFDGFSLDDTDIAKIVEKHADGDLSLIAISSESCSMTFRSKWKDNVIEKVKSQCKGYYLLLSVEGNLSDCMTLLDYLSHEVEVIEMSEIESISSLETEDIRICYIS